MTSDFVSVLNWKSQFTAANDKCFFSIPPESRDKSEGFSFFAGASSSSSASITAKKKTVCMRMCTSESYEWNIVTYIKKHIRMCASWCQPCLSQHIFHFNNFIYSWSLKHNNEKIKLKPKQEDGKKMNEIVLLYVRSDAQEVFIEIVFENRRIKKSTITRSFSQVQLPRH